MNLLEKIESDLKDAIKKGESLKSETLKMVKSDLMYEKAKTGKDLSPEQMLEVTGRAAKRRKEAMEEFRKGNRPDLAEKEAGELAIIETYLPKQMTEEEIEKYIAEKITSMGQVSQKDTGKLMGELMKELKGKADGGIVKKILSAKVAG
ncbi:MAG: GatB/YqeY domain-containing protein [Spirochaetes bacterium]|jgi:hypothetical protein|nr:GatB/YqeY domain-containing protein [Spirochaetota bacterium]